MEMSTFARIGVVGFTGCGKSILAHWIAKHWIPTAGAVFISDPKYEPAGSVWEGWGHTVHSAAEAADAWLEGHRIIRLAGVYGEENLALVEIAANVPRSRVIMDESHSLMLPSDFRRCPEPLQRLVNQGRVQQQGIMLLGQAYSQLPAGYRMQSYIYAANQNEGTGRTWLKERAGKVPTIPKYHWLVSSPDGEIMDMSPVALEPRMEVKQLAQPVENKANVSLSIY